MTLTKAFIILPTRPESHSIFPLLDDSPGNKAYSKNWEWFDPFQITSIDEIDDLPAHWQSIITRQNNECWECGYRFVHAPVLIKCHYPSGLVKGIFAVTRSSASPEDFGLDDLIHLGGEFLEDGAPLNLQICLERIKANKEREA